MADILKDRNYYRMLSDQELKEEADREQNELALVILRRQDAQDHVKQYGWRLN